MTRLFGARDGAAAVERPSLLALFFDVGFALQNAIIQDFIFSAVALRDFASRFERIVKAGTVHIKTLAGCRR